LKAIETQNARGPVIRRPADALFVMTGADAVTHWLPAQLQRENGYVRTGREMSDEPGWAAGRAPFLLETNLPGFFCAGDIRYTSIKRVSSSVGEGSMAVAFVHQYLACFSKRSLVLASILNESVADAMSPQFDDSDKGTSWNRVKQSSGGQ
jgi:thioredoxin reductase (NADPH)